MSIPTRLPGVAYGPMPRAAAPAAALQLPPRLVVIHDTANTASAANEAHYAATRTDAQSSWTSAHFYVDAGGPLGSCPLNVQAWAAYSYANSHGWHIEMCGTNAGTTGAVPAVTIAHTAALVRTLCQLGGIPMVKLSPADVAAGKRGICGHWDITQGLHVGTHDDPGPAFDWSAFIAAVTQGGDDMAFIDDPDARNLCARNDAMMYGRPVQDGQDKGREHFVVASLTEIKAAVTGLGTVTGGLTDADRKAITDLTTAINALNSRLSTP